MWTFPWEAEFLYSSWQLLCDQFHFSLPWSFSLFLSLGFLLWIWFQLCLRKILWMLPSGTPLSLFAALGQLHCLTNWFYFPPPKSHPDLPATFPIQRRWMLWLCAALNILQDYNFQLYNRHLVALKILKLSTVWILYVHGGLLSIDIWEMKRSIKSLEWIRYNLCCNLDNSSLLAQKALNLQQAFS